MAERRTGLMPVLYFLESIRNPICNALMSGITYLGHEYLFLAVFLFLYWCYDREKSYYPMTACLCGIVLNLILKMVFRIPRPWVLDPDFTIVESARAAATGFSFPSGHTQCAVTTFGCIAAASKDKRIRIAALFPIILVPISRMYLGVHTPLDVSVSFVLSLILVFLFKPLLRDFESKPKTAYTVLSVLFLLCIGAILYINLYPFPSDVPAEIFSDAQKNAYVFSAAAAALFPAYILSRRQEKEQIRAVWWAQLLKVVLGSAVILILKTILKAPLNALFRGNPFADFVRYLIMFLAIVLWTLTFPFFSRLGKHEDRPCT